MEGYPFKTLSYNIELKIGTFYVSLEIASLVSDSGLQSSFLHTFAFGLINREALLWTFSKDVVSLVRYRLQTGASHSNEDMISLKSDL